MKCHSKVLLVKGAENAQTCYGSLAVVGAGCGKCGKEPKVTDASLDRNGRNAQEADFAKCRERPITAISNDRRCCSAARHMRPSLRWRDLDMLQRLDCGLS